MRIHIIFDALILLNTFIFTLTQETYNPSENILKGSGEADPYDIYQKQNDQCSVKHKQRRQLTVSSFQIYFDDTNISSIPASMKTYIKKVADMSNFYLSQLIQAQIYTTPPGGSCGALASSTTVPGYSYSTYILLSFINDPLNTQLLSSDTCKRDATTYFPVLGLLTYNIAILQSLPLTDNYDFKQHVKTTTQEIIRVFGFRLDQLQYWINPTTSSIYGSTTNIITKTTVRGFVNSLILVSPFVAQTARDYYNCVTATGMQLENQENLTVANARLDFERTILYNEALTATILDGDSVFSIFTGSLLKDMGYFSSVNFNLLDDITFGKGKGCDFMTNACYSTTNYPEFNKSSDQFCDFNNQGIGQNISDNFVDPGCLIPSLTKSSLCANASIDLLSRQIGGFQSRCFNSKAVQQSQSPPALNLRCHQIVCSDNYQTISIRLLPTQQLLAICTSNQQGQNVNLSSYTSTLSDVTTGILSCPSDYKNFCLTPSRCLNDCSMNGICVRDYCICRDGFAGTDCSQICPLNQYWNGTACTSTCPVNQYVNPNNTCQSTCPDGYYIVVSNISCLKCDSSCRTCQRTSTTCLTCNYPLTFDSTRTLCQLQCSSVCQTCFGPALNQCFTCISGYYLSGTTCVQCISPCLTCSSATSCNSCVSTTSYTLNTTTHLCNPVCDTSCLTCSAPQSSTSCLTCRPQFYLSAGKCLACDPNCNNCTGNSITCKDCNTNYYLFNSKCYATCTTTNCSQCSLPTKCSTCNNGYYVTSTGTCGTCSDGNCLTCSSASVSLTCKKNYYLSGNTCVALPTLPAPYNVAPYNTYKCQTYQTTPVFQCLTCSPTYYLANNQCSACSTSCYTCVVNSNQCTSCNIGYYLVPGANRCDFICHTTCLTCSAQLDSTKCLTCSPGYVLSSTSPSACVACDSTHSFCQTCNNSISQCLSCIPNYTLVGNTCSPICDSTCLTCSLPKDPNSCSTCSSGYYLSSSNQCLPCTLPCVTCSTSSTTCLSCDANYSLVGTICQPNCHPSCLTCDVPLLATNCLTCPAGSFITSSRSCSSCDSSPTSNCRTCVSLSTYCTACLDNYQLVGGICVPLCDPTCAKCSQPLLPVYCTQCKDGYYRNGTICSPCTSPCQNCTSPTFCTSCVTQNPYTLNPVTGTCTKVCTTGCSTCTIPGDSNTCTSCLVKFFQPVNTSQCQQCGSNCLQCSNFSSNCTNCDTGYNIVNGLCVFICDPNCRTCVDSFPLTCTSCNNGFYLDTVQSKCFPCQNHCVLCTSLTYCLTCDTANGYQLVGSQCLPNCDSTCTTNQCSAPNNKDTCTACNPNYFLKVTTNPGTGVTVSNCLQCSFPCSNCSGSATNCTSCPPSYTLNTISGSSTCTPTCIGNCQTCTDPTNINTCTQCNPGYYLTTTTSGSVVSLVCSLCTSPCAACINNSSICTSCIANYSLNGNICLPNCHSSCMTCALPNDSTQCQSCYSGSYLSSSTSVGQCLPCSSPCVTCNIRSYNCKSCISNYFLMPLDNPTSTQQATCNPVCYSDCLTCAIPQNNLSCVTCKDGFYLSYITSTSGKCLPCAANCAVCSSYSVCTACKPNYTLPSSSTQCAPSNCHRTCMTCSLAYNDKACTSCYSDSWLNTTTSQCTFCSSPCKSCIGSSTNCTSCITNYSLTAQPDGTNKCTPICDISCLTCSLPLSSTACLTCRSPNYVLNSSNQCVSCSPQCTSCKDQINYCQSCVSGYQLQPLYPNNPSSLITTCNLICNRECTSCVGYPSVCYACAAGYVLDSTFKTCRLVCDPSCFACNYSYSASSCTYCWPGYYLLNNTCQKCPKGTYSDFDKCPYCLNDCVQCTNATTCSSCRAGYHLDSSNTSCIQNEVPTVIVTTNCNYSCVTCIGSSYTSCVTCPQNRYFQSYLFSSIGTCICRPSFTDNGTAECEYSAVQNSIESSNTAMYASSLSVSVIIGTIASNPVVLIGLLEVSQNLSFLTYVNYQSKVGLDQNMQTLYSSHLSSLFNLQSLAPNKGDPSLTSATKRLLETSDRQIMLSEVDTGVSPSVYEQPGNDKILLNNKSSYFAINSLPIVVLTLISWILSALFTNFWQNESSLWKQKVRNFFYKSFPLVFFYLTYQELTLLIFFQFEVFNFESSLDGFSSLYSIIGLLYQIGIIAYIAYVLEIKGIFKFKEMNMVTLEDQTQQNNTATKNFNSMAKENFNNKVKIQNKQASARVAPLQIVDVLPEVEQRQKQNQHDLRKSFWILEEYFSHETLLKRIFIFVILGRKFINSIIQITAYEEPILQAVLILSFHLIYLIYIGLSQPFKQFKHMLCYCVCELIIVIVELLLIGLVSTDDIQSQINISYAILSFTLILMCIFIVASIVALVYTIHLYCIKKHTTLNVSNSTSLRDLTMGSAYKRSKNILTQIENNQKTQSNEKEYKNIPNDSVMNQTKYTSVLNESYLDETQQNIQNSLSQVQMNKFASNVSVTQNQGNNNKLIFNTKQEQGFSSSERIILLDEHANIFHFIAPRVKYEIQPILSEQLEQ